MKRAIIFALSIFLLFVFASQASVVFARIDVSCTATSTYPWCGEVASLGELVRNFYTVALGLAGGAAFGVIVYGAIMRMTAAGSPSGIQNANEWITGALLGVVLLFGAVLILRTINPDLVNLRDILGERRELPGGGWDVGQCRMEDRNYRYGYAGESTQGHLIPRCPLDDNPKTTTADTVRICSVGSTCYDWTEITIAPGSLLFPPILINVSRKFELLPREQQPGQQPE